MRFHAYISGICPWTSKCIASRHIESDSLKGILEQTELLEPNPEIILNGCDVSQLSLREWTLITEECKL